MPTKGGPRPRQRAPAIHPYEAERLRQCMRNKARLEQLGIPVLAYEFGIISKQNKPKQRNCEGTESEYDPEQDDTGEGDSCDGSNKDSSMNETVDMPPGGIKARPAKRVRAEQQITRVTRSKKSIGFSDPNSVTPTEIPHTTQAQVADFGNQTVNEGDNPPVAVMLGDAPHQPDDNTHMPSRSDAAAHVVEHNQMANDEAGASFQPGNDNIQQHVEGTLSDTDSEGEGRCIRGMNMGKGLQRLSRARRGKLPVVISEGSIRPTVPLIAAKFATECNIAVRSHVPVLKHWKEYKKQPGLIKNFVGKLGAKFDMDISAAPVQKACSQMMKSALRQQRYRLKKKYFDPYPLHLVPKTSPVKSMTDEQWNELVEIWKNPIKMATCEKNKANRAKVKFHQTTGSRSYMVHLQNLGDKYSDEDPNALDLFKECHYSKKTKCFTPSVQFAITQMENKVSEDIEGEQQPKSVTEVVAEVLAGHTKQNKFLQNVGIDIQNVRPRSTGQNLEAELMAEKTVNADLRLLVNSQREQIDVLSEQLQEAEQARMKDREEMQKKQAETDAKLELLLSHIRQS